MIRSLQSADTTSPQVWPGLDVRQDLKSDSVADFFLSREKIIFMPSDTKKQKRL
jgi:hypothetical protein